MPTSPDTRGPVKRHEARAALPPVESLRPTLPQGLIHMAVYTFRNAVLCAAAAVFLVQPIYMHIIHSDAVQRMSNAAAFTFIFTICCHAVPWITVNGVYAFMDSLLPETGHSPLLRYAPFRALGRHLSQYKLPRRPTQRPSAKLLKKTVTAGLVSASVSGPLLCYLLLRRRPTDDFPPRQAYIPGFAPQDWAGADYAKMLVSFCRLVPHFMIANVFNEVFFFAAHGTLHSHPTLYRVFHKQHHEYTGTISIAAEYAGLLETLVANLFPTVGYFVYMLLFRSNDDPSAFVQAARAWPMFATWFWERLLETYETHSGYCFSNTYLGKMGLLHGERARFHDFHHTHNVGNYGTDLFTDAIFRTEDAYLKHRYLTDSAAGGQQAAKTQ